MSDSRVPRNSPTSQEARSAPTGSTGTAAAGPEGPPPTRNDEAAQEYNFAEEANGLRAGFNRAMGLRFSWATGRRVVASLQVGEAHLQPYGLVHGGVYAGIIETAASTGAALSVLPKGQSAVGLENATSFLRAVREGVLTVEATPLAQGARTQVWEGRVTDESGQLVAHGRVRLLVLDAGAAAAGATVALAQPEESTPDASE